MTKDKKELEALSSLCSENNVMMIRSLLPEYIRNKRKNLKSGIQQCKGSIYALGQVINMIRFYKARSKNKIGWIALETKIRNFRSKQLLKKEKFSSMLDDEFKASKHSINVSDKSNVTEISSTGKLNAKIIKPTPINKQTMNVVDYKKGDVFIK